MKALIERLPSDACPETVVAFDELESAALQSSKTHADVFSIGGFDAEAGVTLGVNLRVFLTGLIQRRGFEIVRDWLIGLGQAQRAGQNRSERDER